MKRTFIVLGIILTLVVGSMTLSACTSKSSSSTSSNKYTAMSDRSDKEVENFAQKIVSLVKENKKDSLAELVAYPINIKIDSKKMNIANSSAFVKNYDKIMTPNLKKNIEKAKTTDMFVSADGVMLGGDSNNIWFRDITENDKQVLKIIGINN